MIWKLLPILLLSGCGLIGREPYVPETKQVEVVTVVQPAAVYHPPLPNAVSMAPVEWKVLTPDTMREYLADLDEGNAPMNAYYGVSPKYLVSVLNLPIEKKFVYKRHDKNKFKT